MERLTEKTENGYVLKMPNDKNISDLEIRFNVYDKLGAYEDAEEQGLLLKLPCPIGTTVYVIEENGCEGDFYNCHHNCEDCQCYSGKSIQEEEFEIDWIDAVGQFVFLTREEAEKALADMGV